MIAYFDTSAIIPLLVDESGSASARRAWDEASRIVSIPLVYPETRAALAQANRAGRLTSAQLRALVGTFDERYPQLDLIQIDSELVRDAGELAESQRLRGYDAVHLAAALRASDPDLVLVGGDRGLLAAARELGLPIVAIG